MTSYNKNWNNEYQTQGIPSSIRETPSKSVTWFLENYRVLGERNIKETHVLDIGCGAGRNSLHMARQGAEVTAFDGSDVAIQKARAKVTNEIINFAVQDLTEGFPVKDNFIDIALDIFVYKHQTDQEKRKAYRAEMSRVLKDDGLFLLSLADKEDGYYKNCPTIGDNVVIDPAVNIESILFSYETLKEELSDHFTCEIMWRERSTSHMHGETYPRTILTTVWRKND